MLDPSACKSHVKLCLQRTDLKARFSAINTPLIEHKLARRSRAAIGEGRPVPARKSIAINAQASALDADLVECANRWRGWGRAGRRKAAENKVFRGGKPIGLRRGGSPPGGLARGGVARRNIMRLHIFTGSSQGTR